MSTNKKLSVSLVTISIVAFVIIIAYLSMVYIKIRPSSSAYNQIESLRNQRTQDSIQLVQDSIQRVDLDSKNLSLKSSKDSISYLLSERDFEIKHLRDSVSRINR